MPRFVLIALAATVFAAFAVAQPQPVVTASSPPVAFPEPPPVLPAPRPRLSVVREQVLARFGAAQPENRIIVPSSGIGRVYRTSVSKPGATSLRFHFEVTTPADDWIVQVLRPTDTGDEVVVWTQSSEEKDDEFWSDEVTGSRARIEVLSFKPNSSLRLRLARTMMAGPVSFPFGIIEPDKRIELRTSQPTIPQWSRIQKAGKSVARLRFVGDDGNGYFCTGFMISKDLFLTNEHCIQSKREMRSAQLDFDYLSSTSPLRPERLKEMLPSNSGLDYAVFRLKRKLDLTPLKLKSATVLANQPLLIIGHPAGEPEQVSIEGCKVSGPQLEGTAAGMLTDFGHLCDTLGGNSGSPVFDGLDSGEVIGLHHLGYPEGAADPVNQAVRIELIINDIRMRAPAVAAEIP